MKTTILVIQIIISLALAAVILLQGGGAGLGSSFGGGQSSESFRTRRGVEKFLLYLSFFLAASFFVISLASFLS